MRMTRFDECRKYTAPKHDVTIHAMHLQHRDTGCDAPFWVGCSYYLPQAKAEMAATPLCKVYVMLDGNLTIELKDGSKHVIGKGDSVYIEPNEEREIRNETNAVATMLVVMPYPPA